MSTLPFKQLVKTKMTWSMLEYKRADRTVSVICHTGKNGQQLGSSEQEDAK